MLTDHTNVMVKKKDCQIRHLPLDKSHFITEKEEIVYLEQGKGRNTIVCLTEKGEKFTLEKIYPLHEIENKIWNEWTSEEQQQYLTLTKKYRDGLKKYLDAML